MSYYIMSQMDPKCTDKTKIKISLHAKTKQHVTVLTLKLLMVSANNRHAQQLTQLSNTKTAHLLRI